MSNTSIIGAALVIGFFVYITVKGELPAYLAILGIGGAAPAPAGPANSSSAIPFQNVYPGGLQ